jgi:hypothetical protein
VNRIVVPSRTLADEPEALSQGDNAIGDERLDEEFRDFGALEAHE